MHKLNVGVDLTDFLRRFYSDLSLDNNREATSLIYPRSYMHLE